MDNKKLVYVTTLGYYKQVLWFRLIPNNFSPNINHIALFENLVAYTLIMIPNEDNQQDYPGDNLTR